MTNSLLWATFCSSYFLYILYWEGNFILKIYILLSLSGTYFSHFLRIMSPGLKYPHVSISFDKNLSTLYSFGRKKVNNPLFAGFVEEHPNTGVFGKFNPDCNLLELEITDEQYTKLKQIVLEFKKEYQKYNYNYMGLVFTFFKIPRNLNNRFTCTQFIAYALNKSNVETVNKPVSLILPTDYYDIPNSRIIYKGKLKSYVNNNL